MDPSTSDTRIGASIERLRCRAGLTQVELARRSRISVRALREIEQNRVRRPHADSVRSLVAALDLSEPERDEVLRVAGLDTLPHDDVLRVDVLGPLSVTRGGRTLDLSTTAQRGVLGLLVLHANQPVSRDEIVQELWGADPPKTCVTQVHMAVGQLRTLLEPSRTRRSPGSVIQFARGAYTLALDNDQVDLLRFSVLAGRGRSLHRKGAALAALEALDEALRCWRGPVLSGENPQLRSHPAALAANEQRLAAALCMADLAIELSRYEFATVHLRNLLRDEPYHEGIHARLMVALAGCGERAAALRLFADVRGRLLDELGVEPAHELRAAHLRVLRDEVPRRQDDDDLLERPAALSLLPPDIPDFTGRAVQIGQMKELLGRGSAGVRSAPALVVAAVAGMGGVGKTALAVHVAHQVASGYPDGQLFVNLRGAEPKPLDPAEVLARFLRSLGVDSRVIPDEPVERAALYRSRLAGLRVLVVLDNAASEEQIRPLLPGAATCAVLVTSRTRLTGVEGVRWIDLDMFTPADALELLASVTDDQRVSDEPADAAEIVKLCGYLPLAVRVAGARLTARPGWRLAYLAGMLRDQRRRLDHLATGDLEVRASLALSYQGLDGTSQQLFRMLGLFDTLDFPPWMAACLLDTSLDEAATRLDALVDAQLLSIAGTDQTRYRFHDLVRLYARERAEAEDSAEHRSKVLAVGLGAWLAAAERMAAHVPGPCYAAIQGSAPRPAVELTTGEAPLTWFDTERAALLVAVHQACDLGLVDLAFDLAGCLEKYFDIRGMYGDWRATNERVMQVCQASGNVLGEAVMLRGLIDVTTWNSHESGEAMARLHANALRLLEMFTSVNERRGMADAGVLCSWGLSAQAAYPDAVEVATTALLFAEATGHLGGQARAHVALAIAHGEQARLDVASAHLTSALDLARAHGNSRYEATVLQFQGIAYRRAGALDASQRVLDESLAISQQYGDHYAEALTMLVLARVYLERGDPRARASAEVSLALGREYNLPHHIADALGVLGEVELADGRRAEAIALLEESVHLTQTCQRGGSACFLLM